MFSFESCRMYLFLPFFMYFVITVSELVCESDAGIGTMQPVVIEGDIGINDYFSIILIEYSFSPNAFFLNRTMKKSRFSVTCG